MMQQRTRFGAFWDAERTDLRDAVKAQLGSKRSSWIGQIASGHCNASPGAAGVIVDAYNAVADKRVLGLGDVCATCAAGPHYKARKVARPQQTSAQDCRGSSPLLEPMPRQVAWQLHSESDGMPVMLIVQLRFWLMAAASAYVGVMQVGAFSAAPGPWIVFALIENSACNGPTRGR